MPRVAAIRRQTGETRVEVELALDGGDSRVSTGIGFLDHMLDLTAKHGRFGLRVEAQGDLHVDQHHTTEDVGICLGQALDHALGDRRGIRRYGSLTLPMDESLVTAAVDLGGRYAFRFGVSFPTEKVGAFDLELVEHFWASVAENARCNLHFVLHHGSNSHHIAEAVFKAGARALREAVSIDPDETGVPSTKGTLNA